MNCVICYFADNMSFCEAKMLNRRYVLTILLHNRVGIIAVHTDCAPASNVRGSGILVNGQSLKINNLHIISPFSD